jgi:hypothetical protein
MSKQVTPLRQRMIDDMASRNSQPAPTQHKNLRTFAGNP